MRYTVKKNLLGKPRIHYNCPRCDTDLVSPLHDAGKVDVCPECDCGFHVPGKQDLLDEVVRARDKATQREVRAWAQMVERQDRTVHRREEKKRDEPVAADSESVNRERDMAMPWEVMAIYVAVVACAILISIERTDLICPFAVLILVLVGIGISKHDAKEREKISHMSPGAKAELEFGNINPKLVCPHCQVTGQVRTKPIDAKKGVSGGKATAALLTGGVSLLAVGLSRKERNTQAHCMNCESNWVF